jgi:hypothetical protein
MQRILGIARTCNHTKPLNIYSKTVTYEARRDATIAIENVPILDSSQVLPGFLCVRSVRVDQLIDRCGIDGFHA